MRYSVRVWVCVFLGAVLGGCDDDDSVRIGDRGSIVLGRVTDEVTGLGVDSVVVSFGSVEGDSVVFQEARDVLTDKTGQYSLVGRFGAIEDARVRFRKAGFVTHTIDLPEGADHVDMDRWLYFVDVALVRASEEMTVR